MGIVLWRINFKSIPCMREHFCRQSCYPCLVAKHDQSSGEGGCTVRTLVLFQRSWRSKHLRLWKTFQDRCSTSLSLWQLLDKIKRDSSFEFFTSWWTSTSGDLASSELASDDVITSEALCTSGALFFRRFRLPFCWFFCSLLLFQNLLKI